MTDTTATGGQKPDNETLDEFLGAPPRRPWWRRPTTIVGAVILVAVLLLLSRCFAGEGEAQPRNT